MSTWLKNPLSPSFEIFEATSLSSSFANAGFSQPVEESQAAYESARLRTLQASNLLDERKSEGFDRITRMACRLFHAPMAALSLTDENRQFFKSYAGTQKREFARIGSPCAEVTRSREVFVVSDLLRNSQFEDCQLAQSGIRFYAGAPLTTRDGFVLGALCVLDGQPRGFSEDEIASLQDLAAMVMAQIELQHNLGRIDPASGLPNRNQLAEDLERLQHTHKGQARTLILVELADPRQLNEMLSVLGSLYADTLIKAFIQTFSIISKDQTSLYHVGTVSFAVLLDEEIGGPWRDFVKRLAEHLKQPTVCNGIPICINAAFGVSPFSVTDSLPSDSLRTAVSAVHDAREAEIDYASYSPANDRANCRRLSVLTQLREALHQSDQLSLVYQPRVDIRTGVSVGAEALLRWRNPLLGNIGPAEFIPLAEQTALSRPVTQWVLASALQQISSWQRNHFDVRISINISARNLEEKDFVELLAGSLRLHGVSPKRIELEFTESALIRNRANVVARLNEIRSMGIELAIDDFGTGYSTFSYLHNLPATVVKLDQSFMIGLPECTKDQALVASMISMAHDMGYRVVAEGVETAEVYEFLANKGCDEAQGYFISRPLIVSSFEDWLREGRDRHVAPLLQRLEQRMPVRLSLT